MRQCPFCNSQDLTVKQFPGHPHYFQVTCDKCGARGPKAQDKDSAFDQWTNYEVPECTVHDWHYPVIVLKDSAGMTMVSRYCMRCGIWEKSEA